MGYLYNYTISAGERRISETSTGQDQTDTRKPTSLKWMEMDMEWFPTISQT